VWIQSKSVVAHLCTAVFSAWILFLCSFGELLLQTWTKSRNSLIQTHHTQDRRTVEVSQETVCLRNVSCGRNSPKINNATYKECKKKTIFTTHQSQTPKTKAVKRKTTTNANISKTEN